MEALEEALRRELREPVPLPQGFTARLLERVAAKPRTQAPMRWQAIAAVAALVAVLGAFSGIWQGRQVKHRAAIEAQQQLVLALRITDATLRSAGRRVDSQLARNATLQEAR